MKKSRNLKILLLFSLLIVISGIFLTSCNSNAERLHSDKPIVYTSFFPIYDLVNQVAGDTVDVKSFMPMNKDPHLWEPTAKDMKNLAEADILFVNGANMEMWVDKVEENIPDLKIVRLSDGLKLISYKGASELGDFQYMTKIDAKKNKTYRIEFGHTHEDIMRVVFIRNDENLGKEKLIKKGKEVMKEKGKLIAQKEKINVEEDKVYSLEMGHQSGRIYFEFDRDGDWYMISDRISEKILSYNLMYEKGDELLPIEDILTESTSKEDKITFDPHSWLSINNAKTYLKTIRDVLTEKYPENANIYKKAAFKSQDNLTNIHAQYKQKFLDLDEENKDFVVTHYAWEYLAQEFGLVQYPLQGLVTTESPSLKTIRKAISFCEEKDIDTIFYETNVLPKSAETLAEEIGGKFVDLTSMEYVVDGENMEIGSYNKIMEQNLEKIYNSIK